MQPAFEGDHETYYAQSDRIKYILELLTIQNNKNNNDIMHTIEISECSMNFLRNSVHISFLLP